MRLLPAASLNLRSTVQADDWLRVGEAEHFRARCRNLLLFDDAAPVLRALQGQKLDFVLLKGAALVAAHYKDPGLRPMSDLDLLVRPRDVDRTVTVLHESGYTLAVPLAASMRAQVHAQAFNRDGAAPIDLHWRSVPDGPDDDDAFWEGTSEATLGGVSIRVPGPADLLLNACIQGLRFDWDAPQRWVLDAMAILHSSGPRIDWSRLVMRAAAEHHAVDARDALRFLCDEFGAEVPREVITDLTRIPVSASERLAARSRRTRPDLRGPLLAWAMRSDDHQRLNRRGEAPRGIRGLLQVWQRSWDLDHTWKLPAHALARGTRRLWQLLRHHFQS